MSDQAAKKAKGLLRLKEWAKANPERAKQTQANWRAKNKDSHRAAIKRWKDKNKDHAKKVEADRVYRRFFWTRAKACVWRTKEGNRNEIANAIFWIWRDQRGRCAMTGKKLDRTAELDHIIPISKGGTNARSNLQWLSPEVNQCKNDLTVQEFINICKLVINHVR